MAQIILIKRVPLFILVGLASLLLAACGDDSNSEDEASSGITVETGLLTKAQFIKRADSICQGIEEAREKLINEYLESFSATPSTESTSAQAKALVNTVLVPAYQKLIDRISALGAPPGDEDEISAFLISLQKSLENGQTQPLEFVRAREPFPEGVRLSNAYGFDVCLS